MPCPICAYTSRLACARRGGREGTWRFGVMLVGGDPDGLLRGWPSEQRLMCEDQIPPNTPVTAIGCRQRATRSTVDLIRTGLTHRSHSHTSAGHLLCILAATRTPSPTPQSMSARYAPLPNPHTDPAAEHELNAAFDDDDDDDSAPRPNARTRNGYTALAPDDPHPLAPDAHHDHQAPRPAPAPGTYDFENVDYDYDYARPPPGSPPSPTARARPNEYGNSNGLVPQLPAPRTDAALRGGWLRRTAAAVLPSHYVRPPALPAGPVGGGSANDGVFANVTAKPSRPRRIQDGDETYLVPEDVQKDAPPSYAHAQADAVPPYWETTVHAPSAAATPGDVVVDALPTGSAFSFLWNALVSISFQLVGFLLTYLLHTTHAAKLGSRAGLGVTLIQYGFAMRTRGGDGYQGGYQGASTGVADLWNRPYFETAADAEEYYKNMNTTAPDIPSPIVPDESTPFLLSDATSEWLSFLLMTVGWFVLLTSLLGFWRVKRWERGILNAQRDAAPAAPGRGALAYRLERALGLQGLADGSLLRIGFGFPGRHRGDGGGGGGGGAPEEEELPVSPRGEYILPLDPNDPERNARIARAYAVQARLHEDLRSAGLI
ncbi:hypothetical protein AcV5_001103 [Taiwanofungus camphoratus]|nr:hypothetical protein AcV5_001103 [Antrodia cinnamomea]